MDTADDILELINSAADGFVRQLGLHIESASADKVVATLDVDSRHHQGYGIVHGGVYCSIAETLASIGAALHGLEEGRAVAGLENHTSFIRSIREGRITGVATPITRGRRSQLWEVAMTDDKDRLVATGRVRLHVFEPGQQIAGEEPRLKRG